MSILDDVRGLTRLLTSHPKQSSGKIRRRGSLEAPVSRSTTREGATREQCDGEPNNRGKPAFPPTPIPLLHLPGRRPPDRGRIKVARGGWSIVDGGRGRVTEE